MIRAAWAVVFRVTKGSKEAATVVTFVVGGGTPAGSGVKWLVVFGPITAFQVPFCIFEYE